MPEGYHLAQMNIGRLLAPIDDPLLAGFVARLDEINTLAERSPGFVWRLQTDAGNATALRPYDDALVLIGNPDIDVVIEATGDPATGIRLASAAVAHGKHIVTVNVEADALAGPLLAR